ncbi:hypothetical protein SRS16P2_00474 (plasmid) [Variovorax sp. SRS16]|uniref:hypothetical protein n=1 Tax=Variovorax sp. SRS16 TaxID=282217 RepID=UPI0013164FCF|nr:hypothetical protein [Variovorax sp. SRS16]VTU46081.1 hypothetical protein SRS16P2_00474 [Variovorax sp. SRS16]
MPLLFLAVIVVGTRNNRCIMNVDLSAHDKLSLAELHFHAQSKLQPGPDELAQLAQMMAAERFCAINAGVTDAEAASIRLAAKIIVAAQRRPPK